MTQSTNLSIPSKVILLGEYAVLSGAPAVVAALTPRFELRISASSTDLAARHPDSPVGKLKAWAQHHSLEFVDGEFRDPFQGAGGFGGSTAEFALAYMAMANAFGNSNKGLGTRWDHVWGLYRELTRSASGQSPSGADLCAQWRGGTVALKPTDVQLESLDLWEESPWQPTRGLAVFSTTHLPGMKTATHTHLDSLKGRDFSPLSLTRTVETALRAIEGHDWEWFGRSLTDYGDLLRGLGLECAPMTALRAEILAIPGVLGAKGAGAMQSDALIVAWDAHATHADEIERAVIQRAEARALRQVQKGLFPEPGISLESEPAFLRASKSEHTQRF